MIIQCPNCGNIDEGVLTCTHCKTPMPELFINSTVFARIKLPLSWAMQDKIGAIMDEIVKDRSPDRETIVGESDGWLEFSTSDRKSEEDAKRRLHETGEC